MANRKKPCAEDTAITPKGLPPAYYTVHALLETIRMLQCQEDDLCTLLAEIQRSGKVGAGVRRELLKVLHNVTALSLHAEMTACFAALEERAA
ncbi:MAG TPA: hypothetical protein VMD97_10455 [Candidatus Aquilonibacter sp.]|nr:hypothetical protein [Candidatus Aquilonibacter sp.]